MNNIIICVLKKSLGPRLQLSSPTPVLAALEFSITSLAKICVVRQPGLHSKQVNRAAMELKIIVLLFFTTLCLAKVSLPLASS